MNRLIRHTARCLLSAGVLTLGGMALDLTAVAGEPAPAVGTAPIDVKHTHDEAVKVEVALLRDPTTFTLPVTVSTRGDVIELRGAVPTEGLRERILQLARRSSYVSVEDKMTLQAPPSAIAGAAEMTTSMREGHVSFQGSTPPPLMVDSTPLPTQPTMPPAPQPPQAASFDKGSGSPSAVPPKVSTNKPFILVTHGDTEVRVVRETPVRRTFATPKRPALATRNEPPMLPRAESATARMPEPTGPTLPEPPAAPAKSSAAPNAQAVEAPSKPPVKVAAGKPSKTSPEVVQAQASDPIKPAVPVRSDLASTPVVKTKTAFQSRPPVNSSSSMGGKLTVNGTQTVSTLPSGLPRTRVVSVQVNSMDGGKQTSHSVLYVVPDAGSGGRSYPEAEVKKPTLWTRLSAPFRSDYPVETPQITASTYSTQPANIGYRQDQRVVTLPEHSPKVQPLQVTVSTPVKPQTSKPQMTTTTMTATELSRFTGGQAKVIQTGKTVVSSAKTSPAAPPTASPVAMVGSSSTAPKPMPVGPAGFTELTPVQSTFVSSPPAAVAANANPRTPYQSRPLSYQQQLHYGQPAPTAVAAPRAVSVVTNRTSPPPTPPTVHRSFPVVTSHTSAAVPRTSAPSVRAGKIPSVSQTSVSSEEPMVPDSRGPASATSKATSPEAPVASAKANSSPGTSDLKQMSASNSTTAGLATKSNIEAKTPQPTQPMQPAQPMQPMPQRKASVGGTVPATDLVQKVKAACGKFASSVRVEKGTDGVLAMHVYAAAGSEQMLTSKLFEVPELTAANIRLHVHVAP